MRKLHWLIMHFPITIFFIFMPAWGIADIQDTEIKIVARAGCALQGPYTYNFSGENGFFSSGKGSFAGSVSDDSLTLEFAGTDEDSTGSVCEVDGSYQGSK